MPVFLFWGSGHFAMYIENAPVTRSKASCAHYILQEITDSLASYRIAKLAQCLCLDLTDTLSGYVKFFSNFFQSSCSAVIQSKT